MVTSRNDPDFVFEDYKGYIIASHKDNVPKQDINNLVIVYSAKDFPDHGYIVGIDDSKDYGYRKAIPNNIQDAKDYINWAIEARKEAVIIRTSIEINEKMIEKGYDTFNVKHGGIGVMFKDAVTSYLINIRDMEPKPGFPIYAATCLSATDPNSPSSWARFTLVEDVVKGFQIGSVGFALYECHDGPLRASLNVPINSLEDIPSKQEAGKLIEAEWQRKRMENVSKWQIPDPSNASQSKRRKL